MHAAGQAGRLASIQRCAEKAAVKGYAGTPRGLVAVVVRVGSCAACRSAHECKLWRYLELVADVVFIVATTKHSCSIFCTGQQEA